MVELGYSLSSEEHTAPRLVAHARRAESSGSGFALISDHFHPWLDEPGESPSAWSTIGAIAKATTTLAVGTGVTCPLMRIHPAIVAQAAATCATLAVAEDVLVQVLAGAGADEETAGQVGPDQAGVLDFDAGEAMPALARAA